MAAKLLLGAAGQIGNVSEAADMLLSVQDSVVDNLVQVRREGAVGEAAAWRRRVHILWVQACTLCKQRS